MDYYQIEDSIKKEASLLNIKKVLVAVSGGSDSMAALFILNRIGLEVRALNCNFHLRGKESDRDTEMVINYCHSNDILLYSIDFDVKSYLKTHKGISIEMACRNLRHEWFRDKLREFSFDRIATGHNVDDDIETFFLNVLRGSGTRGLKGMSKDNGVIWRPLLTLTKKDIIDYNKLNKIPFVIDSTNLQSDYRRNYLRNKIFPLLREEWKGFDTALTKTIKNLEAENKIVEKKIDEVLKSETPVLSINSVLQFPAPLLLIKRFIDPLNPFTTTPEEVLASIKADKPHIRKWNLRKGTLILHNGILSIKMSHSKCSS